MGFLELIMLDVGFWRRGVCKCFFNFFYCFGYGGVGNDDVRKSVGGKSNMFRKYCLSRNPCDAAVSVSFLYRVFSQLGELVC